MAETPSILASVLVAEDNSLMIEHLVLMLEDMGAEQIFTARSAVQAFDVLARARTTLAIVDIQLGLDNGLLVADRCSDAGVPVILSTGYGELFRSVLSNERLLQKPYTQSSLEQAISELIARQDAT